MAFFRCALSLLFAGVIGLFLSVAPASAQYAKTYLSSSGDDSHGCYSPATACRNLQPTMNATAINGIIICVDSLDPGYGSINKSITIDCSGTAATIQTNNITINIPVNANDPLRTVRLRGISLNGGGLDNSNTHSRETIRGIEIIAASAVFVENVVITDFVQQGIYDHRTGGQTKLFVTDTIVRNNGGTGIALGSQGPSTTVLDNVRSEFNSYGLGATSGNNVSISRSVFSGNSVAGVEGDTGAQVIVDQSTIGHNNIGVQSNSSVRLSNSNIAFNNTAISGGTGSFGNNRLSGNGTDGTNLIPLGGASSDVAQK